MATDRLKEGVDALQRGDRAAARAILEEVVGADPQNETAWYYLAASQDDPGLRRTYLERVLIINPNNQRARDVLQKLDESEAASQPAPQSTTRSQMPGSGSAGGVRPISSSPAASSSGLGAAASGGFSLPFTIPDAPEKVGIAELFRDGMKLFLRGVDALQSKTGVYEGEMGQATWWRFWLLVAWCAVVGGVVTAAGSLLSVVLSIFLGRFFFGAIIVALITLIISIPVNIALIYGATYISHWYAKEQQKSSVPLLHHAYTIALYAAPAALLGALATAITSIIGLGFIGSLASLALNIYALYLIGMAFKRLHQFTQPNQEWITIGIYFVAYLVFGAILGVILGVLSAPFLFTAAIL